jgi:hypothetical protein
VATLPSGLQYKILQAAAGKKPTAEDTVVCQYRGTLIDGKEFDSSYKRNQPATFQVNRVIKGWSEALQLMPAGSKWQLFIPSGLAYGERGAGPDVPPNSTLIFEVELVSIKPKILMISTIPALLRGGKNSVLAPGGSCHNSGIQNSSCAATAIAKRSSPVSR